MTSTDGRGSGHGNHGNPVDLDAFVARMEAPDRAGWQKPDEVVAALALAPGQSAAEIGAGTGYFALRFARALGERGAVFAVEIEPKLLELLRNRIEEAGAHNVTPVLGLSTDPLLPPASCDLIAGVNAFHHIEDRVGFLRRLKRSLKPGGRLVDIDFHKRELPVGPPLDHKLAREEFLACASEAGFELFEEHSFLPYQYFLVLRARI